VETELIFGTEEELKTALKASKVSNKVRDRNLISRSFSWSYGVIPLPMKIIGMDA